MIVSSYVYSVNADASNEPDVLFLKLQEAEECFGGCMPKMIWLNSAKNAIVDLTPGD